MERRPPNDGWWRNPAGRVPSYGLGATGRVGRGHYDDILCFNVNG